MRWISMDSAFKGASNMMYNAVDIPDLSRVSNMSGMFAGASSFHDGLAEWGRLVCNRHVRNV